MAAFHTLVDGFRKAERELEAQLAGVKAAIASLSEGGLVGRGRRRGRPPGSKNKHTASTRSSVIHGRKRKRRKMSAAARKAISDAQKARWAKQKGEMTARGAMRSR